MQANNGLLKFARRGLAVLFISAVLALFGAGLLLAVDQYNKDRPLNYGEMFGAQLLYFFLLLSTGLIGVGSYSEFSKKK